MPEQRPSSGSVPGIRLVFLGTGTSLGVPAIGCTCGVCRSDDPRNKRLRTSLYLQAGGIHVVVDIAPDFRMQALTNRIPRVDALVFTHSHADHILGFDDIRRYNTMQDSRIPAYGSADTVADMNRIFDYIHHEHVADVYRPRVDFHEVSGPFMIGPIRVTPFNVEHAPKTTYGFKFEACGRAVGYFPDCHVMPSDTIRSLQNLDVMVLDALRARPHSTHLSLGESVEALRRIGARRSFVIHMSHDLDHSRTEAELPESMFVSFDGLALDV
ncbi:MAG: MBL fold metallo-hydrolase [bacterium]